MQTYNAYLLPLGLKGKSLQGLLQVSQSSSYNFKLKAAAAMQHATM
jgi:hypothetical protein